MAPKRQPEFDRFWRFVEKTESCWNWTGANDGKGYGLFTLAGGRQRRAHRYSFELAFGPLAAGSYVCHRCDNPSCVRPSHLFEGTPADNARDRAAKGRGAPQAGEHNPLAKLSSADVAAIRTARASGQLLREIAAKYGIAESAVSRIANGVRWRAA